MESVLASLAALMLRALPTLLILVLLHFYLKAVFFRPLEKALSERKAATAGVRKLAEQSLEKAEKKTGEYEEALRVARNAIYREQDEMRRRWREEQTAAVAAARRNTETLVQQARQEVEAEAAAARVTLRAESDALAEQISRAVLAGGVH